MIKYPTTFPLIRVLQKHQTNQPQQVCRGPTTDLCRIHDCCFRFFLFFFFQVLLTCIYFFFLGLLSISVFVNSYEARLVDSMGHDILVSSTSEFFLFCRVTQLRGAGPDGDLQFGLSLHLTFYCGLLYLVPFTVEESVFDDVWARQ